MTTKDEVRSTVEALKMALEALEDYVEEYGPHEKDSGAAYAITAIREALASEANEQPAPVAEPHKQQSAERVEPVAVYVGETWCGSVVRLYEDLPLETPLYTSPQPEQPSQRSVKPWVSLTDDEVKHQWEIWRASIPRYVGFAKGIEAKLKEKNGF